MKPDSLERNGVKILHHFGAGTYAKETRIPAGVSLMQHKHPHDHMSILAKGQVVVTSAETVETYSAPACLLIPAGAFHSVRAITDAVWYCIHATNETDPERVDSSVLEGAH